MRLPTGSTTAVWWTRAPGGVPEGVIALHVGVPERGSCQTSFTAVDDVWPPNTILRSPAGAYTAGGKLLGVGGVPAVASNDHTGAPARSSARTVEVPSPPNRSMRWRIGSTIAVWPNKVVGGTAPVAVIGSHACGESSPSCHSASGTF